MAEEEALMSIILMEPTPYSRGSSWRWPFDSKKRPGGQRWPVFLVPWIRIR